MSQVRARVAQSMHEAVRNPNFKLPKQPFVVVHRSEWVPLWTTLITRKSGKKAPASLLEAWPYLLSATKTTEQNKRKRSNESESEYEDEEELSDEEGMVEGDVVEYVSAEDD